MISFFRKFRQKLLSQNRVTRYLVYAIGEIFLVTIGILIALQVNNWNEGRKENNFLSLVYEQIQKELQTDTLNVRLSIEDFEERNERLEEIVHRTIPVSYYDTLNEANYHYCEKCQSDISNFEPFQNLDKGYQLLKSISTNSGQKNDSLIFYIDSFYSNSIPTLEDSQDIIKALSIRAIDGFQQYEWFVGWSDLSNQKYDKEFILYLFESEEYRKACAHYLLFSRFALRVLREYQQNSIEILRLLDEKLKENQ